MDGHQKISANPPVRIVDSAARGPWSTAGVPAQVDFGHEQAEPTIAEYWTILARRKYRILLVGVVGAIAALLLSMPRTPIYQARASLEVDTPNGDPLRPQSSGTAAMPSPSSAEFYIATRVEILESRALLRRVVERLKLDARPEFHYSTDRFSAWRKALDLPPAAAVSAYESAFSVAASSYKIVPSRNTGIVEVSQLVLGVGRGGRHDRRQPCTPDVDARSRRLRDSIRSYAWQASRLRFAAGADLCEAELR